MGPLVMLPCLFTSQRKCHMLALGVCFHAPFCSYKRANWMLKSYVVTFVHCGCSETSRTEEYKWNSLLKHHDINTTELVCSYGLLSTWLAPSLLSFLCVAQGSANPSTHAISDMQRHFPQHARRCTKNLFIFFFKLLLWAIQSSHKSQ